MKKLIAILSFVFFNWSCSKDETPAAVPEIISPTEEISYYGLISKILPNTTIQEFNWDPSLTSEIGYTFSSGVSGKITAVELKLPFVNGSTDIHLWDYNSRTIITTININMAMANTIIKKNIEGINIVANKKYVITFESNVWYRYQKNDPNKTSFPYKIGNITYHTPVMGARDTYPPDFDDKTFFQGDVAFTFLKN